MHNSLKCCYDSFPGFFTCWLSVGGLQNEAHTSICRKLSYLKIGAKMKLAFIFLHAQVSLCTHTEAQTQVSMNH